ncbi:MAG: serine protein kinase, partial [Acidobacteriota bacterium]
MSFSQEIVSLIDELQDQERYKEQHWEGSFSEYLQVLSQNPRVARTAFQRIYDMIVSHGVTEYTEGKRAVIRYHFFEDRPFDGVDAIYGLDVPLMNMVNVFQAAAQSYGTERRVLLLHGPVGSAKSTVVRLLKKGLEEYSKTPDGALFSFRWMNLASALPEHARGGDEMNCPMHEEPLHLIPLEFRLQVLEKLNAGKREQDTVTVHGELCPACRQVYRELLRRYEGDWTKLIKHVHVYRLILSEKDRIGVGTFQPKDEKNQDSTELTGDINYRKIAEYGSDSDPRAFNFDGEFNIANRGLIEFIEVLKLDVDFLYDLLGASQEHKIKPKKFAQTDIDEVIIGHTNEPEYKRLQNNEFMEA